MCNKQYNPKGSQYLSEDLFITYKARESVWIKLDGYGPLQAAINILLSEDQ
jgi:hypothetical protein